MEHEAAEPSPEEIEIARLVAEINERWLEGRYGELWRYFDAEMVLAMPGFERRVEGAEAIIESYREFGDQATIHRFELGDARVDVLGPSAVVATGFAIDYDYEGTRYRETGTDLLVFVRKGDDWSVRWRTVVPEDSDAQQVSND